MSQKLLGIETKSLFLQPQTSSPDIILFPSDVRAVLDGNGVIVVGVKGNVVISNYFVFRCAQNFLIAVFVRTLGNRIAFVGYRDESPGPNRVELWRLNILYPVPRLGRSDAEHTVTSISRL